MSLSDKEKEPSGGVYVSAAPIFIKADDGSDVFVGEKGENGGDTTYQLAAGAPVEAHNPLGYRVGFWTCVFMNVGQTIGTGIFSTPSNILKQTGSVGLSLVFWVLGVVFTLAGVSVYLELASYYPSRSGSEVVYLEQAYPRPKYFFPISFAFFTIVLSFNSSNAVVLAQYIFRIVGRSGTDWELKGVAIAGVSAVCLIIIVHTPLSLRLVNIAGTIKILTLVLIAIAGLVVLGGHTRIQNPTVNFQNGFQGTGNDAYNISNALVSILYSYQGYANAFNVLGEVKNPVRTMKYTANLSVLVIFVLYFLCNIAYFAAIPKAEIMTSQQITASLFFAKLWGDRAARGLTILPVLSALGNILAVIVGQSRMIREVGRQGVLPWPKFWITTKPFGSPIGAVAIVWLMTMIMILAPPAGSAFNFIVALKSYPDSFYLGLMAVGLLRIRRSRKRANLPRSEYRSWTWVVLLFIATKIFLLVMPWVPPKGTLVSTSFGFFYAAATIGGLGVIALCGLYYIVWTAVLPRLGGYVLRQRVEEHEDGSVGSVFVKVPLAEVDKWDAEHDASGRSTHGE